MAVASGPEPLVRKGDLRRNLMLVASVDTRIVGAADRRIRRAVSAGADSAGETVQRLLPDSKVVKAFNIIGNPFMINPEFPGGRPTMFICGNDDAAKKFVYDVAFAFGHEPVDIGGIENSRLLESLAMLWIVHYFRTNSGNHAFKLLRK